jgi:hypothetical protein
MFARRKVERAQHFNVILVLGAFLLFPPACTLEAGEGTEKKGHFKLKENFL